ncbi:MAG: Rrf2 family transcriptional regulator [Rickettsiales bacterium]|jgi:Rrf2 family transcriptional regulator, iron-sulfur cluster assembly transcription factor|nr:Rrf2 family transcriptional regulator [Rickettsiales bacterium]
MQLTAKTNYAIRALIDIAPGDLSSPKSLQKIAKDQNIKLCFLSQIFSELKKGKIVKSVKGPGGGYVLAKEPKDLYLIDVFNAVHESCNITSCKSDKSCISANSYKCSSHFFLKDLSNHVTNYLQSVSIANLSEKYNNYLNNIPQYEQKS